MRKAVLALWHRARGGVAPSAGADPSEFPNSYGDLAGEWRAAHESACLFDASERERLLATGPDRVGLLDSLSTNDLKRAAPGTTLETAFLTPRGRLVADARVTVLDDAILLELEAGRSAPLGEHVAAHRVAERAELADASAALVQLELWGPRAAEVAGAPGLAPGASQAVDAGGTQVVALRSSFGLVLYVPAALAAAAADDLAGRLAAVGGRPAGRDAIEIARVELGLGRFGLDWDEKTHPLEAGLGRAISYTKGCYVGQEVVAKATYVGRVARLLVRLEWEGAPAAPGTPLLGARAPGRLASCAALPDASRVVALGYVRHDAAEPGTRHRVGEGGPEATVLGPPCGAR